jgi:hypothetical protein
MRILHVGGDCVLLILIPSGVVCTAEKQGIDIVTEAHQFILERVHASVVASEMERQWKNQTKY